MSQEALDGIELKEESWWAHDAEVAASGLFTMVRRLPALIRDMLALTWRASRVDTVVMVGCGQWQRIAVAGRTTYVLDQGRVAEEGDHASSMALGGIYAEMYGLQARSYI
ncbi:hypothetical protein [Nonomuraea sp. bgisy101]|uniref:hypothetical protein n=1 Tax=Nonomuraea sp. bgisy101 TaxID=3413784 RepID=UPI003D725BBC